MKIIGARINKAVEDAIVTKAELAELTGLTYARIWQLCTEHESNVNRLAGEAIAARLGVTSAFLSGGE